AVELGSTRREHDDRHLGGAAQLAAQVAPVPVGEREIQEHEVGRLAREARPKGSAMAASSSTNRMRAPRLMGASTVEPRAGRACGALPKLCLDLPLPW